jgi:anthranilate phosphoribosyltransferase
VFGIDGLDEISMSAPTKVCEVKNGTFASYEIKPEDFGFKRCSKDDLVGGTPEENAQITREILDGKRGPKRDAVLMNAGAAIYMAGKADSIAAGIEMAKEIIDSGKAKEQLEKFIELSNQ